MQRTTMIVLDTRCTSGPSVTTAICQIIYNTHRIVVLQYEVQVGRPVPTLVVEDDIEADFFNISVQFK